MSVDLHVTGSCGCFVSSLAGVGVTVALCKGHSARLVSVFDGQGRPEDVDEALVAVYGDGSET